MIAMYFQTLPKVLSPLGGMETTNYRVQRTLETRMFVPSPLGGMVTKAEEEL